MSSPPVSPSASFSSLGLSDPLLRATEHLGFVTPTPIQVHAIPAVATGRDVVGEAPTGSGKTAAFALPLLDHLQPDPAPVSVPRVLVLVPTRELALQVAAAMKAFGRFLEPAPRVLAVIGGEPIEQQIQALAKGVDVVVGTPGRTLDLVDNGHATLRGISAFVLDEADKLLDLGFADALDAVLAHLPSERQTLLFSATIPDRVAALAERVQSDPITVRVDEAGVGVEGITQRVFEVDRDTRRLLLQHLIQTESWSSVLVFVATRRASENLARKLRNTRISAAALHGKLEQHERIEALKRFRSGGTRVLVATDLAARGIDIKGLDAVVNVDLPRSPRDYIHRIGRTGRAGATGVAVSFVDHQTAAHFRLIEKRCGVQVPREQMPGFPLTGEAPQRKKGPPPTKGKRKSKKDKLREAAAREAALQEAAEES